VTKRLAVPAVLACIVALSGVRATSQQLPPGYIDPQPILAAAEKAIGTANLTCVTIAGTAYAGAVGQARESARNVDWPRTEMANYTRTMNWDARTMKEEFDRKPGLTPAAYKYGTGWVDGPLQQNAHQTWMVNGNTAWFMDGPNAAPVAVTPDLAEIYQLDLWLNPHGFLKAARLPGANPKATWRWELGEMGRDGPTTRPERMRVVSISFGRFRIDATVNRENMLQRIHTWVPDPALGDMNYEHEFTNDSYIDVGGGVRFPTGWHSHQGWDDNYGAQNITAGHNAFGGALKDVRANVCPDPVTVPQSVRQATFPVRVDVQKIGSGVYVFGGSTHNSVAVEFRDFIAVFEAPHNEERALAVIDEIVKVIPDKPIRYVVNSHQHFDHVAGLRAFMHVGATIVTHVKNYDFLVRDVLNYSQRTLKPDMVSLWPPTELAEGYFYEAIRENFVISDGTRQLNVHYMNPLQHVEGMLIAYLPGERLLFEADIFDTDKPRPAAPTQDQRSFFNQVGRLGLDVAQIVPVHGGPVPWSEFARLIGGRTN